MTLVGEIGEGNLQNELNPRAQSVFAMGHYDFCRCGFTEGAFFAQITATNRLRSEMNVTSRTAQLGRGNICEFGDTGIVVAGNLDCST